MLAIILNSGQGVRLGEASRSQHKSMLELYNGESILHRQIRLLGACGISNFLITLGPFAEQLRATAAHFPQCDFSFVENPQFACTNYIYTLHLARDYMNGTLLLLHGDLVFNQKTAESVIACGRDNCVLANCEEELPEKDFKARIEAGRVREISVSIFGGDCCACQPFYKISASAARAWRDEIAKFIARGETTVYAENALNGLLHSLDLAPCSYAGHYVAEIDTMADYARVNAAIKAFDMADAADAFINL